MSSWLFSVECHFLVVLGKVVIHYFIILEDTIFINFRLITLTYKLPIYRIFNWENNITEK